MKRILALFTIFFYLAAFIAGCAPASTTGESETPAENTYGPLSEEVLMRLQGENFTLRVRMSDGESLDELTEMTLVQQLPNYALKYTDDTNASRIIMQDGAMYLVSDTQQTVLDLALMQLDPEAYEIPNVAVTTNYLGSGTDTVNGRELAYEEYDVEEGATARYYFDGEAFVYIVNHFSDENESDIVMEIIELSDSVDASVFQVPESYLRIETMDDLAAYAAR